MLTHFVRFFVHLIHVLPDDVLAPPLLLLLLDKCVSRSVKAKRIDTDPTFSLCQTLINELGSVSQTRTALALMRECKALSAKLENAEDGTAFLQSPS